MALSWGEEVLPGVHMLRRSHNPHVELARLAHDAMMRGAPVAMTVNYDKIHEDITALLDSIERLEESNRFMVEYLAEQASNSTGGSAANTGAVEPTAVDGDDDEVVRDAIKENLHIIITKRKELKDLQELTRVHYCSHDHRLRKPQHNDGSDACEHCSAPLGDVAAVSVSEMEGGASVDQTAATSEVPNGVEGEGDDGDDDTGNDDVGDTGPFDHEGGEEAMSMAQMGFSRGLRWCHAAVFALTLEGYHYFHFVITMLCRIGDCVMPCLLARFARRLLGRRRHEVRIATGLCVGEEVPRVPFLDERTSECIKFEGVPYARIDERFGPPVPLPDDERHGTALGVLNAPRFTDSGFRFGSAAALAPQVPALFTIDAPVAILALQTIYARRARGYLGSIECLQLNLWVPKEALFSARRSVEAASFSRKPPPHPAARSDDAKLPVLVFFHGGAFIFGTCHQTLANGQALSERGRCIVVSCNYRMGILGYLNVPGAECQNRGLRDQVEALRWVKRNIAAFGGDPDNITVSGQSAGSMSVGALLGVQASYDEQLFQKAVMISGTPQYLPTKETARAMFELCVKTSDMTQEAFIATLQHAPIREVIQLQAKLDRACNKAYRRHQTEVILPFQPFIESTTVASEKAFSGRDVLPPVLPYHPVQVLRHRKATGARQLPLLIGSTREEYTFFTRATVKMFPISDATLQARVRQWVHSAFRVPLNKAAVVDPTTKEERAMQAFAEKVEVTYAAGEMAHRTGPPHQVFTAVNGDYLFRIPSEFLATTLSSPTPMPSTATACAGQGLVWVYRFDRPAVVSGMGATHAMDLHYFFNSWWCPPYYTGGWSRAVQRLSNIMATDLLAFVSAREVDAQTLPWPVWNPQTRPQKLYGSPESPEATVAYNCDVPETEAWGDVMERLLEARNEETVPSL